MTAILRCARMAAFPALLVLASCGSAELVAREVGTPASTVTSTTTTTTTTSTTTTEPPGPTTPSGLEVPVAPRNAQTVGESIETSMAVIGGNEQAEWPAAGHQLQLAIRTLQRNADWEEEVIASLPADLAAQTELHLNARRSLGLLHTGFEPTPRLPLWEVIPPEPLEQLIAHYQEAEAATDIDWHVLAAINLIETGMGRIDGLSTAGAQGPMQFLPTTWEEVSQGGDIDDPHDAIQGAARYLVRRGGDEDIRKGLWGYNNSDDYVDAVLTYAQLFREYPEALRAVYHWEIYVGSTEGTLWLPVGFLSDGSLTSKRYLADNPWARTLPQSN